MCTAYANNVSRDLNAVQLLRRILAYPPFADNPGVVSPGILTFPGGSVVKVVVTDASDLTVPLLLNSVSSLSFLGNTTHTAPVIGLDKASAAWKKAHLAATG